jgi:DNA-binding NarL/FixJ family response regulator
VAADIEREFERNGVVVTIARSLTAARVLLKKSIVDVVIVEIFLPDGRGESLLPDIEACARQPAVIVTSVDLTALQASALEYRPVTISKPVDPRALLRIARTVARGFARPVIGRFIRRFNLTKREAEATMLVSRGFKAKEIADRMRCSEKVVYAHLARACKKTGCHDYHEVVALILAFTCHVLGHTPPEHAAFVDRVGKS